MPVMLLPPITYGIGHIDADPLTDGPRYVRTGGMSRWHRPRSGVRMADARTIYSVWCGQHVGGSRAAQPLLTTESVTDGAPVCATCDGRAVGAGQEENGPAGRTLVFGPRSLTPPRWCPGSRRDLYEPLPGATTGRCLACSDSHPIRAMGGPYASRAAIVQHPPGERLFAPCPFHRWRHPALVDGRLRCVCGRPLTSPQ
ncbi:hypothetical protein QEN62_gp39 [Streptomyces phage AxeJC]|uniref:Uncharacterized protein n=1 Tax=Streptomyces phage AxeJC TaxID=2926084 RepID=A0A9E7J7E8_9CAUD|nr:hypothetical protein QEN62_gp39 [Streptomyces phage AxeJC]URC17961.1 hypothetical protein SEA_AXEJC_39 [Streptomyces phage AxeJC]